MATRLELKLSLRLSPSAGKCKNIQAGFLTHPGYILFAIRALEKLIFGGDSYRDKQGFKPAPEPATLEVGMTEADLTNMNLGAAGAIIVGAWITHKDNGALTSLNISNNKLTWGTYKGSGNPTSASSYETVLTGEFAPLYLLC